MCQRTLCAGLAFAGSAGRVRVFVRGLVFNRRPLISELATPAKQAATVRAGYAVFI